MTPVPKPSLLFLAKENPFPATGGAHLRDASIVQYLSQDFQVEILCYEPLDSSGQVDQVAIHVGNESTPPGIKVTRLPLDPPALWSRALANFRPNVQNQHSEKLVQLLKENAQP